MTDYSHMIKNREKCVLCGNKIHDKFQLKLPVFMGVNINKREEIINDITFCECENCGEVQVKELFDLNLIYDNNHNLGVVGELWENHYKEFAELIKNDIEGKTVLEISDPSCKIVSKLDNFKHWYIVEPNPDNIELNNVTFIKTFFDENFNDLETADVLIHSHLLEHIFDPKAFFKKSHEILSDDGVMFFSVPNMQYLLDNGYPPTNILHFEHTYYIDSKVVEYLAKENNFTIEKIIEYKNHSVFYKLRKNTSNSDGNVKLNLIDKFTESNENSLSKIQEINDKIINENNVYLFGAHVTSQFFLFNGLDSNKIKYIIDNSVNKQGYELYGTKLMTKSPNLIEGENHSIVICSHTGVYSDEIKKQLKKLNENIILL